MAVGYWDQVLSRRLGRRRALAAMGATALGALLVACGGGGGGGALKLDDAGTSRQPGTVWFAKNDWKLADETKQAVRGGIYRGVTDKDQEGHFDALMLMASQLPASAHIHEMFMSPNRGPGVDPASVAGNRPVGALAESWEIASDGMTVTWTMRQGVKWHPIPPVNGRVMDLDDWKTSQERHLAGGVYRNAIGEILDKVEFPDARHLVWKLKAPYAPIVDRITSDKFAFPIQPKELNANVALAESTAIGTGYKILDKYQPSIDFQYRKHKDFWGGDPFIARWHVPIIPEYANRYSQFVTGNLMDFAPTAADVLLLHKDAPDAVIVGQPIDPLGIRRFRFGRISPAEQPWADPRVRVAIRRSIDFKSIGEFISNKVEFERNGIPVEILAETHMPHHPAYWLDPEKGELGKVSENYIYSPAEARKLIAAAGFQAPIPLRYPIRLERGALVQQDQLMLDSFAATGTFKLEIERVQSANEYNRYRIEGRFDGVLGTISGGSEPDYLIMRDYHSQGRPPNELPNPYTDPRVDALGEAQRRELDVAKRNQILKDIQILLAELMPSLSGHHRYTEFQFRWPWLHNSNYGGTESPPSGRTVGGHLHWLDVNMPNREKGAS